MLNVNANIAGNKYRSFFRLLQIYTVYNAFLTISVPFSYQMTDSSFLFNLFTSCTNKMSVSIYKYQHKPNREQEHYYVTRGNNIFGRHTLSLKKYTRWIPCIYLQYLGPCVRYISSPKAENMFINLSMLKGVKISPVQEPVNYKNIPKDFKIATFP